MQYILKGKKKEKHTHTHVHTHKHTYAYILRHIHSYAICYFPGDKYYKILICLDIWNSKVDNDSAHILYLISFFTYWPAYYRKRLTNKVSIKPPLIHTRLSVLGIGSSMLGLIHKIGRLKGQSERRDEQVLSQNMPRADWHDSCIVYTCRWVISLVTSNLQIGHTPDLKLVM